MPENTVKVCRPSKYGNPFHVADVMEHHDGDKLAAQADCVRSYRRWIEEGITSFCADGPPSIGEIRRDLAGKNLACWCKAGTPCHAEVLLDLANDQSTNAAMNETPKIDVMCWPVLGCSPCSAFVLRAFPKPCHPRKKHQCVICGTRIEIKEPCCSWSGLDQGEGYRTAYAHPECYAMSEKWDDMDWECRFPGDDPRPETRMYWPNVQSDRIPGHEENPQ